MWKLGVRSPNLGSKFPINISRRLWVWARAGAPVALCSAGCLIANAVFVGDQGGGGGKTKLIRVSILSSHVFDIGNEEKYNTET